MSWHIIYLKGSAKALAFQYVKRYFGVWDAIPVEFIIIDGLSTLF